MANDYLKINSIQFDETFYTVPSQFYQLWTIFVNKQIHYPSNTLPYDVQKSGVYTAIVQRISTCFIDFKPTIAISYWEPAPRNSFKEIHLTSFMNVSKSTQVSIEIQNLLKFYKEVVIIID